MIIAPTEPPLLKSLGTVNLLPESFGCDVLFNSPAGLVGVQRKEISDLTASAVDGRLGKEFAQMKVSDLAQTLLIIEGRLLWTSDGMLLGRGGLTLHKLQGLIWRAQSIGCWITFTLSLEETIDCLLHFEKWCREELGQDKVSSLLKTPKLKNEWGLHTNREWGTGLLMHFGLGPVLGSRIYDQYGVPLAWTVSKEELMTVPGIGKGRAEKMIKALDRG